MACCFLGGGLRFFGGGLRFASVPDLLFCLVVGGRFCFFYFACLFLVLYFLV